MRGKEAYETHFRLYMVAAAFEGVSRLERQRLVSNVLREEMERGLHALAMRLRAPSEL